jgi:hypothetical protein
MLARRNFLYLTGAVLIAPSLSAQDPQDLPLVDQVPPMLDHILLGCNDLQTGIAFVEQRTGVRAAFGGVHPGRGTQNALLSLGPSGPSQIGHYLEIIAPDPQQHTEDPLAKKLQSLAEPRLVGWAAHLHENIANYASKLKAAGIAAEGPTPGSRKRPDGKELRWQTINLLDDANGLLPFFIEWGSGFVPADPEKKTSRDFLHPSVDAPQGCRILRFEIATPDPAALSAVTTKLALRVAIVKADTPQLRASIRGPQGTFQASS